MPIARQTALPADILNTEGCLHSTMKKGESDEKEVKVKSLRMMTHQEECANRAHLLEVRLINLERGLEGVLRRLEESSGPEDQAGWFGRHE